MGLDEREIDSISTDEIKMSTLTFCRKRKTEKRLLAKIGLILTIKFY